MRINKKIPIYCRDALIIIKVPVTVIENRKLSALTLQDITKPLSTEIKEFRDFFQDSLKTDMPLLGQVLRYLTRQKGKQMRPILVMLSSKLFGEINKATYTAASMIEMLHTATLIHDDVVDESNRRRGFLSINTIWKNKVGVLLGDFMLSKGLLIALNNDEFDMLKVLSVAVQRMSEGELRQLQASKLFNITEEVYYQIIEEKTASLLAACCQCGALANTNDTSIVQTMHDIGINMGMAFQIRDDMFDYGNSNIGKPKRNDIIQRKLTLPIIYSLENADRSLAKKMKAKLKKKKKTNSEIEEIVRFVHETGGLDYAQQKMNAYVDEAYRLLESLEVQDTKAFKDFIQFVITREK